MMNKELQYLLDREEAWTVFQDNHIGSGAYCEAPEKSYLSTVEIRRCYIKLTNALIEHIRAGYEMP